MKKQQINKVSAEDVREQYLLSNGMIHMGYHAESLYDIVSSYSQEGYELLSPQFSSYIDSVTPFIPEEYPVVTEISGCEFSGGQRRAVEAAVWNHYHLRLSRLLSERKYLLIRMAWFAASMILASCLLFCVSSGMNEVLSNIAYLPFYFFGYRLITYFFLGYIPLNRDVRHCRQIAGMKLFFSGAEPVNDVPADMVDSFKHEIRENISSREDTDISKLIKQFIMEDGVAKIICSIADRADIVQPSSIEGYELVCGKFSGFISDVIPFIPDKCPVCLELIAPSLSAGGKEAAERAIRTHFTLKAAEYSSAVNAGRLKSAVFSACFILSMLLLSRFGTVAGAAVHEFIVMLFWFFGDMLAEFVLLEQRDKCSLKNKYMQLLNMDIEFTE